MKRTLLLTTLAAAGLAAESVRAGHPPEAFSGGATTVFNDGKDAFALPLANIGRENRRKFSVGNSFFNENWIIAPASAASRDGLGPLFHARSCSACHTKDGRGAPPAEGEVMTGLLLRLSVPGEGPRGGPKPDPVYGDQLAVRAIPGAMPEAEVDVKWITTTHAFPDGETVELRRPEFTPVKWHYGPPAENLLVGPRLAQPVYGMGLLESVPEETLRALADPEDRDGDGISGRVNEVWSEEFQKTLPGRFGWKANQPTVKQQTADAFAGDMGLTTSLRPGDPFTPAQRPALAELPHGGEPEVSDLILDRVATYVRALAVPARRNLEDPEVRRGEALFRQINCSACHVPELKTGADAALPELREQTFRPYTDLLLHDMGPDLADNRPDFLATGSEWRTQPLWGVGLNGTVNGNAFFLHDGRARTLQEAILWHGGEAEKSREAFRHLSKADRAALLRFLESL